MRPVILLIVIAGFTARAQTNTAKANYLKEREVQRQEKARKETEQRMKILTYATDATWRGATNDIARIEGALEIRRKERGKQYELLRAKMEAGPKAQPDRRQLQATDDEIARLEKRRAEANVKRLEVETRFDKVIAQRKPR